SKFAGVSKFMSLSFLFFWIWIFSQTYLCNVSATCTDQFFAIGEVFVTFLLCMQVLFQNNP
ncbi:hypothetical protein L9F63_002506, partial [Diploptera punctata]